MALLFPAGMLEDNQLLRQYVTEHSEEAFAELVRRHVNLVYFAALRRVGGDRHLADDVAQRVFTDLARKAPKLQERMVLAGWLFTSTRFAASQVVRAEQRRRTYEQEAQAMHELHSVPEPSWERLRPVIDDALDDLNAQEREVVLLRFFENLALAEVGAKFSISADAARMRVDRALDKLRGALARRGIASTSLALATIFASQSGLAAPAGLVEWIVAGAIHQAGATTVATLGLWKILTGAVVAVVGIGLVVQLHTDEKRQPQAVPPITVRNEGELPSRAALSAQTSSPLAVMKLPEAKKFDQFTTTEKTILKRLWNIQKISPDLAGVRHGLNPEKQNLELIDFEASVYSLQAEGLVGIGVKKGVVFLTENGHAYCETHREEIDQLP